jgi:hypothetical protein
LQFLGLDIDSCNVKNEIRSTLLGPQIFASTGRVLVVRFLKNKTMAKKKGKKKK